MSWVLQHSRSRMGERLVLLSIADCASADGGNAWPSIAELRQKAGMSERAVQGAIKRLVEIGELVVEYGTGPYRHNRYRVVMDPAEAAPSTPQDVPPADSAPPQETTSDPAANDALTPQQTTADPAANDAPYKEEPSLEPSIEPSKEPSGSELALPADVVDAEIVESEPTARDLIAEWIDHRSVDDKPDSRTKGQIAKNVGNLLAEGIPYDRVRRGLQLWDEKRPHPSTLHSFVQQAGAPGPTRGRPSTTDQRVSDTLALAARYAQEGQ